MRTSGRVIDYNPTITVDDQVFTIALLMPSKAFAYGAKIMKLIGEPVAALASAGGGGSFQQALPVAARSLASNLDNKETLDLVKELFKTVMVDNKMINFEDFFQGRMGMMFKVLVAVIEVQFGDLFQGVVESLKGIVGDLGKA